MEKRLSTKEAADYFKNICGTPFSAGTLRVWRSQGRGPRFYRLNRKVFYRARDIDDYVQNEGVEIETSNSIQNEG